MRNMLRMLMVAVSLCLTFIVPTTVKGGEGTHFYAQANKVGTYYGVWAIIETADPEIREPLFSYASINITGPTGQWVETGWIKSSASGCVPKFSWAIQPGNANIIENPRPAIGAKYQYFIYRTAPGSWKVQIATLDGVVLVNKDVSNPGFDVGDRIQALGEVDSANKLNDMGISGLLTLKWMDSSSISIWHAWNGWSKGVEDNPPYSVVGVPPDPNNNVQVRGNNGNPVPPDAPCP